MVGVSIELSAPELEVDVEEASRNVSKLLDKVVTNRVKRKAKDVACTAFEFVLAVILIAVKFRMAAFTIAYVIFVVLYASSLATATAVYACRLPSDVKTIKEVEDAYERTNKILFFGGLYEIPLTFRFGGKILAVFLWSFYVLIMAGLTDVLFTTYWEEEVFAIVLAVYSLYRLTTDVSEFFVHARNYIKVETIYQLRPRSFLGDHHKQEMKAGDP